MAQRVNGKLSTGREGAETIAIAALGFLAAEPERAWSKDDLMRIEAPDI